MAAAEVIEDLANSLPEKCWLSFSKEDIPLLLTAILNNPNTAHMLPRLVDRLNNYSMELYGRYVALCKSRDDDERETDDGAVIATGDNGAWVQTWTWVSGSDLINGEEEDSESAAWADGAAVTS